MAFLRSSLPLHTFKRVSYALTTPNAPRDRAHNKSNKQGNGTSAHGNEVFFVTLHTAATSAFGSDGYTITNLTERAVQMLEPGQFDVVVFPGGSGNGQAKAVGLKGLEALRKFVQAGGGYMGTCGGAFLGLQVGGFRL